MMSKTNFNDTFTEEQVYGQNIIVSYEQYRNEKATESSKARESNINNAVNKYGSRRMDKRSKS